MLIQWVVCHCILQKECCSFDSKGSRENLQTTDRITEIKQFLVLV